jgi:lactate dehydrogenase-like 2-hydroxyacid dehydrogenase
VLGIVGMGRIGRAVARRARGFGMQIHYTNLTPLGAEADGAKYHPDIASMLPEVDFLSLHAPPLPGGATLLDASAFSLMRPGAIVVNAARGSLIDEAAMLSALDEGTLAAAGLDVFAQEPSPNPALLVHPRVVATPHMASATRETRDAMGLRAIENISAFFAGERPADLITA